MRKTTYVCDFCNTELEDEKPYRIWAPNKYGDAWIEGRLYAAVDLCPNCYNTHFLKNLDSPVKKKKKEK